MAGVPLYAEERLEIKEALARVSRRVYLDSCDLDCM